ncbi:MAG: DUF5063 domain-containing protein [Bacteroidota bacterium]
MEPNIDNSNIIYSKAVIEFITVANEYCLFFEKAENYSAEDIFQYFQKIAPLLYLKGSVMPEVTVNDDSFSEKFVTEEKWEAIFKALREKFGEQDIYYTHDHNYDTEEASLSDNMADIYQDMKDFIMLYQNSLIHAKENAIFEIQKLFKSHWGIRIINALKAVHQILHKHAIDPELFMDDDLTE